MPKRAFEPITPSIPNRSDFDGPTVLHGLYERNESSIDEIYGGDKSIDLIDNVPSFQGHSLEIGLKTIERWPGQSK